MKADFNRKELQDALEHAVAVCPTRTPQEILQGCLLAKRGDVAFVAATDHEISVRANIGQVDCGGEFEAVLPAVQLARVVRDARSDVLTVEFGDDRAEIRSAQSRFTMPYRGDAPDFPFQGDVSAEGDHVELVCGELRSAMDFLGKATDDHRTDFSLGFLCFDFDKSSMSVVGSDGRVMGATTLHSRCGFDGRKLIIPKVARSLSMFRDDDALDTAVSESTICFSGERGVLFARLGTGNFPQWRKLAGPAESSCPIELTVNCDALAFALRQVSLCTSLESCWCDVLLSGGTVTLKARSSEHGSAESQIPVSSDAEYKGTIRPDQILPFLRHVPKESTIVWSLGNGDHNFFRVNPDRFFLAMEAREN